MKQAVNLLLITSCVALNGGGQLFAQHPRQPVPAAKCSNSEKPYRDFDFIIGVWEFRDAGGRKIGDQVITRRGGGCAIVEEWTEVSGVTGLGLSFVDPSTGKWRQVWMSSRFHMDYSGGLDSDGAMILEGTMYPSNGGAGSPVRGVWAKQADGSIKKEFLRFDSDKNTWTTFFSGFAHPSTPSP